MIDKRHLLDRRQFLSHTAGGLGGTILIALGAADNVLIGVAGLIVMSMLSIACCIVVIYSYCRFKHSVS